jgi:hypothetical protein
VNAPGPPFAFTVVGTGGWGWPRNPDNLSQLGIFVTDGRFVEVVDSQGNVTVSRTGRLRDMCAELAA